MQIQLYRNAAKRAPAIPRPKLICRTLGAIAAPVAAAEADELAAELEAEAEASLDAAAVWLAEATAAVVEGLLAGELPEAAPPPDEATATSVVLPFTGMPWEPGMKVAAAACDVTAVGWVVTARGCDVTTEGWPVTTPRELVMVR